MSVSTFNLTAFTALATADWMAVGDASDTTQSAHGSLDKITIPNFFASIPTPVNVTSASATALAVGRLGATTPAFTVDASTASQVAGLKVTGAATGGTVAVVTTDSGADTNLTVNAKGTGTIGIGSVSTGRVTITPVTTITGSLTLSAALVYGGVTLNNAVTGTGNMVLSASPTLTGVVTASGQVLAASAFSTTPKVVVSDDASLVSSVFVQASGASLAVYATSGVGAAQVVLATQTATGVASYRGVNVGTTLASPSATPNGSVIVQLAASGYTNAITGTQGSVQIIAGSLWSATNAETKIILSVTPNASTTAGTVVTVSGTAMVLASLAVSGITTLATSSTINSQTISASANFTGSLTVATTLTTTNGNVVLAQSGGIVNVGSTLTTGASAGDVVLANSKAIRGINAAGTSSVALIAIDSNNVVNINSGGSANVGPAVPSITNASMPANNAIYAGCLMMDNTNAGRFVFYDKGGTRYYITGTAF